MKFFSLEDLDAGLTLRVAAHRQTGTAAWLPGLVSLQLPVTTDTHYLHCVQTGFETKNKLLHSLLYEVSVGIYIDDRLTDQPLI